MLPAQVLIISDDLAFDTFKRIVGEKLGIKRPKRVSPCADSAERWVNRIVQLTLAVRYSRQVFHASGTEVFNMGDIINNDNLYFSAGEPFYRTSGECVARKGR